jgi:hypothetical protein
VHQVATLVQLRDTSVHKVVFPSLSLLRFVVAPASMIEDEEHEGSDPDRQRSADNHVLPAKAWCQIKVLRIDQHADRPVEDCHQYKSHDRVCKHGDKCFLKDLLSTTKCCTSRVLDRAEGVDDPAYWIESNQSHWDKKNEPEVKRSVARFEASLLQLDVESLIVYRVDSKVSLDSVEVALLPERPYVELLN